MSTNSKRSDIVYDLIKSSIRKFTMNFVHGIPHKLLVFIESNNTFEGNCVRDILSDLNNVFVFKDPNEHKHGINKSPTLTSSMIDNMSILLNDKTIAIYEDYLCLPEYTNRDKDKEIQLVTEQLNRFQIKTDIKNGNHCHNDDVDIAVAVQASLLLLKYCIFSKAPPQYNRFKCDCILRD